MANCHLIHAPPPACNIAALDNADSPASQDTSNFSHFLHPELQNGVLMIWFVKAFG